MNTLITVPIEIISAGNLCANLLNFRVF